MYSRCWSDLVMCNFTFGATKSFLVYTLLVCKVEFCVSLSNCVIFNPFNFLILSCSSLCNIWIRHSVDVNGILSMFHSIFMNFQLASCVTNSYHYAILYWIVSRCLFLIIQVGVGEGVSPSAATDLIARQGF